MSTPEISNKKSDFKIYLSASIWGVLLGMILTTWLAPAGIAWYFDPPVAMGVSCKEATVWAMERLRNLQVFGAVAGAAGAISLAILAKKKSRPH